MEICRNSVPGRKISNVKASRVNSWHGLFNNRLATVAQREIEKQSEGDPCSKMCRCFFLCQSVEVRAHETDCDIQHCLVENAELETKSQRIHQGATVITSAWRVGIGTSRGRNRVVRKQCCHTESELNQTECVHRSLELRELQRLGCSDFRFPEAMTQEIQRAKQTSKVRNC